MYGIYKKDEPQYIILINTGFVFFHIVLTWLVSCSKYLSKRQLS